MNAHRSGTPDNEIMRSYERGCLARVCQVERHDVGLSRREPDGGLRFARRCVRPYVHGYYSVEAAVPYLW